MSDARINSSWHNRRPADTIIRKRRHLTTGGRSVATIVALATLLCIPLILWMFIDASRAGITRRIHLYQRDNGTLMRVSDPWRPLPGCLFVQAKAGPTGHAPLLWPLDGTYRYNTGMRKLCGGPDTALLADGIVSPALYPLLLAASNRWRTPLEASEAQPMNALIQDGTGMAQGAHLQLTLDARSQANAQGMAECMTGHTAACGALHIAPQLWAQNIEGAAARMAGVVVLDVRSGAIEAFASAHSACYQAEQSNALLPAHCPLPALARQRALPGKLDHHALALVSPGSLVKPILAVAFMRDPLLGPGLRQKGSAARKRMLDDIARSDTAKFLDRAYCRDLGFTGCERLPEIAVAANDLGWNKSASHGAGLMALVATPAGNSDRTSMTSRFMQTKNPHGQWHAMPWHYQVSQARHCALLLRWEKCQGDVANSASELMGQGNALASPLSIAQMFATIANAANGNRLQPPTHLLQSVSGQLHGRPTVLQHDSKPLPIAISRPEAELILEGMTLTHRGGTASSACLKAYRSARSARVACHALGGVAGKTGTPGFSDEVYTWQQRAGACRDIQQLLAGSRITDEQRHRASRARTRCVQSPIKWYAAVLRGQAGNSAGPWSKVMVVLAERNYHNDGWIDSKGDTGTPNVAAELGFRLIKYGQETP